MQEFEAGIGGANLIPELLHAETKIGDCGVVEKHNTAITQRREPGLEVVSNCFVRVESVDMKDVDRCFVESLPRLVERRSNQLRKFAVELIMVLFQVIEDVLSVRLAVLIARPRIHGKTFRSDIERVYGLAKSAV